MTNPISPLGVIRQHAAKVLNDPKGFLTKREYKKDRESFGVAMILVGVHKINNTPWFLEMLEKEPPDAIAKKYRLTEKRQVEEQSARVEVMFIPRNVRNQEWDESLSQEENIYNLLCRKKFDTKRYEPGTSLFVYLNIRLRDFKLFRLANLV